MNIKNDNSIFLKKLRSLKTKNSDIWINEALFGFSNIKEFCKKLNKMIMFSKLVVGAEYF